MRCKISYLAIESGKSFSSLKVPNENIQWVCHCLVEPNQAGIVLSNFGSNSPDRKLFVIAGR